LERANSVLHISFGQSTGNPIRPLDLPVCDGVERHLPAWRELRELRSLMGGIVDI
jgi:hypothetical protein